MGRPKIPKWFTFQVIVTGWGKTSNNQVVSLRVFSDVLKQVKLPIANNLCTERNFRIDGTQICAGGDKGKLRPFKFL